MHSLRILSVLHIVDNFKSTGNLNKTLTVHRKTYQIKCIYQIIQLTNNEIIYIFTIYDVLADNIFLIIKCRPVFQYTFFTFTTRVIFNLTKYNDILKNVLLFSINNKYNTLKCYIFHLLFFINKT